LFRAFEILETNRRAAPGLLLKRRHVEFAQHHGWRALKRHEASAVEIERRFEADEISQDLAVIDDHEADPMLPHRAAQPGETRLELGPREGPVGDRRRVHASTTDPK
jgi:hypothetical protein